MDYLAYALIDSITDHVFPVLEGLGTELEEMEEEVLTDPTKCNTHRIHEMRRTLLRLRRMIWPARIAITNTSSRASRPSGG